MIVGIPKEIKACEYRVALVPSDVKALIDAGCEVIVQSKAGNEAGFDDKNYKEVGAKIVSSIEDVYNEAEIIVKVKEPLPPEYELFKENQILFSYLHLTEGIPEVKKPLANMLLKSKVISFSYELIKTNSGERPFLAPMSKIAGHLAVLLAAQYLQKHQGGKGILFGCIEGFKPPTIVILGAGNVGQAAAKVALSLGADVIILDINPEKLKYIERIFKGRAKTLLSTPENIKNAVKKADVLINAIFYSPSEEEERKYLIPKELVAQMERGSVIIDVSADEPGAIETIKLTTLDNPAYEWQGIIHVAIPNLPSTVPRTSSCIFSKMVLPLVMEVATKGWRKAIKENVFLACGITTALGEIVNKEVAEHLGFNWIPIEKII